jgi:hypothetical protein
MKPVAWIKVRELTYMQAVQAYGKNDWQTNLGLKPEPDDEGLYTETQVQKMRESFEQSVTDPENQPSQYGTVPMKEWVGLTDEEIRDIVGRHDPGGIGRYTRELFRKIEDKLKEKNGW